MLYSQRVHERVKHCGAGIRRPAHECVVDELKGGDDEKQYGELCELAFGRGRLSRHLREGRTAVEHLWQLAAGDARWKL